MSLIRSRSHRRHRDASIGPGFRYVFDEEGPDGVRRPYLQVQLPDIPILSDIVVHLSPGDGSGERRLRLDGLGSVPFDLPPGLYEIGLLYEPDPSRGG